MCIGKGARVAGMGEGNMSLDIHIRYIALFLRACNYVPYCYYPRCDGKDIHGDDIRVP